MQEFSLLLYWHLIYCNPSRTCVPKFYKYSHHFYIHNNPNTIKSCKILQKLSSKHAAYGVAQSTYPIYRHGKACLSKQPPWRAAGDPRLARGRSRVRGPGPAGALRALFSPPSLPPSGDSFFRTFPTNPAKVLGLKLKCLAIYLWDLVVPLKKIIIRRRRRMKK